MPYNPAVGARHTLRGALEVGVGLVTSARVRRSWILRLSRSRNLFQPYNDTGPDRYPVIFNDLRSRIGDDLDVRLLSFGCSVGDEVFTLRTYFDRASLTGIDISRGNIRECRKRQRRSGDERMRFVTAGTTGDEPDGHYDAVLCMAVLRHGDLTNRPPESCADKISFAAFERTVEDLSRCVKPGGYLVIVHSNFRFGDAGCAQAYEPVGTRARAPGEPLTPLFGRDNRRLAEQEYPDVMFRKWSAAPS